LKTINRKDFDIIGSVVKVHGNFGELKIQINSKEKIKEWAFLEIREKPVPFLLESFRHLNGNEYLIKFKNIDTVDAASDFVGYQLLLPLKKGAKRKQKVDDDLIGFLLIDETHGEIGRVEELIEMPMQLLFKTTYKNNELLIPAVEPIIQWVDDETKEIGLDLPDGLLD
jgi:16S rRNA processing protein RimM